MAQSLAKQKHTALKIDFLAVLKISTFTSNMYFVTFLYILLVFPNILAFSLQIALHFHCKYCVQNGLEFGVQVMLRSHRNCLNLIPRNGEIQ